MMIGHWFKVQDKPVTERTDDRRSKKSPEHDLLSPEPVKGLPPENMLLPEFTEAINAKH